MKRLHNNNPEKYVSSREDEVSSLPEDAWAVAESKIAMTLDEVKFPCQGSTPWICSILQRERVKVFYHRVSEVLLSPKKGWHRITGKKYAKVHHSEKWASSRKEGFTFLLERERERERESELLLSLKERWRAIRWNYYGSIKVKRSDKRAIESRKCSRMCE